jgi:hypothetical protein
MTPEQVELTKRLIGEGKKFHEIIIEIKKETSEPFNAIEIEEIRKGLTNQLTNQQTEQRTEQVNIIKFGGLKPMNIPRPESFIPGLIPTKRLTSISGQSGTGKTVLAANIFDAISGGNGFLGFDVKKTGSVYYECYERGADFLMETFDRVFRHEWPNYPNSEARYVSPSTIKGSKFDWIKGMFGRLSFKPDVVILDHVSKLVPYNTTACSNFLEKLEEFGLQNDIAFIVLFQPVKGGKGTAKGRSEDAANFSTKVEMWPIGGRKVKITIRPHLGEVKGIIAEQDNYRWKWVGEFDPDRESEVEETQTPESRKQNKRADLAELRAHFQKTGKIPTIGEIQKILPGCKHSTAQNRLKELKQTLAA